MTTYTRIEAEVKTCAAHCDYDLTTSETENLVRYCIATKESPTDATEDYITDMMYHRDVSWVVDQAANKNALTDAQLEKLRKEIILGSLYVSDYENSFGIDLNAVCCFFEGFCDFIDEKMADDGYSSDDFWDVIKKYDNIEYLSEYYNSCEYPFGND